MGKLRVLHVRGDEYAAMEISQDFGIETAFNIAFNSDTEWVTVESNGVYCEFRALVFDNSDRELVHLIKDELCDYDALKTEDIFILD